MLYTSNQTPDSDQSTRDGESLSATKTLAIYLVIVGALAATFIRALEWAWRAITN